MDIAYFLLWWLALAYIGLVAWHFLHPILKPAGPASYALSKALGLLILTWLSWAISYSHIISYGPTLVWAIAAAAGVIAIWQLWPHKKQFYLNTQEHWRSVVWQEGLFATCLAAWSLVRAFNPRIEGVEKFMNIANINSVLRTATMPPADPWYANDPINYYYFGHTMMATLSHLSFVPSNYAFNLGVATIFALCVVMSAAFIYHVTSSRLSAGLAAFLITLSSNLDPAINTIKQTKDYIFFSATRLDPYTINEFPLYSFLIADLHAHTMDLPIALAIIGLLYVVHQSKHLDWRLFLLVCLAVGATSPTNAFDAIVYGGLSGLVLVHRQTSLHGWTWPALKVGLGQTILVGLGAVGLYAPFYLFFHSPTGGLGIALFKTPLDFILINFGVMLFLALPLLIHAIPALKKWQRHPAAITTTDWFVILLAIMGLALIIGTEFFYVKDIYDYQNPPYYRANTIFKIYYQAWVLLSLAAAYGAYLIQKHKLHRNGSDLYAIGLGLLVSLSLVGTYSGFSTIIKPKNDQTSIVDSGAWTLDGYRYLATENPDQLALINWINTHIAHQSTIVEAHGDSYTQESRISSYTGLPTILGWASHEWGWRYSENAWPIISSRIDDIKAIYQATTPAELSTALAKYNVAYIVASPVETTKYSLTDFNTIAELCGQPVFSQGQYQLYQVPLSIR